MMSSLLNDSKKNNRKQKFSILPLFQSSFALLFLFCLSANSTAQNCPDNLIQNPGVESGLTDWAGGGTFSTDAHTGSGAINVCQSGYARQTMTATVGSTYTLTFWAKNSEASVPTFGRVKFLTSSWQPISEEVVAVTSTTYNEYSVENTAPPNTAWVEISVRKSTSGSGCTVVDDFCFNTSGGGNNGGGNNGGGNNGGSGICGNNLLDNPGFENTFDQWNGTSLAISTTAASGAQALKLCQNATARQTLPYTADNELTFLFSARDEGAGTTVLAYIKYLSATWQPLVTEFQNISTGISYAEYSFSKAPPAGTAHVQVGFIKNSPNCILIDDLCLSEGGGSSGSCSFVKTYLPYELASNTYVLSPLNKNADNMTTWFQSNQSGSIPQLTSLTTDLSGNFIEQSVTPLPPSFIDYSRTLQNSEGDFVQIGVENAVPYFIKTNKDGTEAWRTNVTSFTQTITNGRILDRSLIADGTGYIGAFGNSDISFLPPNQGEIVLIKIDANGQFLWQKTIPGLARRFPDVQIFALTADAIYANVTTDTGYKVYKFNRSNGDFIWASPSYLDATSGYKNGRINDNGQISIIYYDGVSNTGLENNTTYLLRINSTNGAFIGSSEKVNNLVGSEDRSFVFGHLPTADGGLVISAGIGSIFSSVPNHVNKIFKVDANLNLVWELEVPVEWEYSPKQLSDDGGILFLGEKGNDLSILQLTANGALEPACSNACSISSVDVSNIQCDNNGTPTDPLDDTFSFSVTVNSDNCQGGTWIWEGSTGSYGVTNTLSGIPILGNASLQLSFADAANPNTTLFTTDLIEAPAFCSDQPLGCGFEAVYNNSIPSRIFQPPFAENLPNGGFSISGQTGGSSDFKTLILDETGVEISYNEEVVLGSRFRTPDGNYASAEILNGNNIIFQKTNASGTNVIFSNNFSLDLNAGNIYNEPVIRDIVQKNNAYYIAGTYAYQPIPNNIPTDIYFTIKTDLNGNKLFQSDLEGVPGSFPNFFQGFIVGESGSFYYLLSTSSSYTLHKVNAAGEELWSRGVLGDLPSSDMIDFHEAADGNFYVTRYDNSFGYVRKLNGENGENLWQYSSAQLPIPNNSAIFGYPDGSLSTADGGAVFAMGYSTPGNSVSGHVIGRLSSSGQLIWSRTFTSEYNDHRPILVSSDGGYLFGKRLSNGDYSVFKTTSTGELAPTCSSGGNNLADLTLTNLSLGSVSIPAGQILNYSFDLLNIGTASTGSYSIKAYISTDPQLSNDDIQDGTIPTGNLAANTTITDVGGASTIPSYLSPGNYYLILKVDADEQITESNESNNLLTSSTPFSVSPNNNNGPDLALSLSATPMNPGQWNSSDFTLELTNSGTEAATAVKVAFMNQSDSGVSSLIAYQDHTEPAGTTFNSWQGIWTVGTIAAGATVVLTYKGFSRTSDPIPVFAQVSEAGSTDSDSSPGNNNNGIPAEDDETLVTLNASAGINFSGLETEEGRVSFKVYPNPAGEMLNVALAKSYPSVELTLYNNIGVTFLEQTIFDPSPVEQLDMSEIPNGQYLLRISTPDARASIKKVVVLRTY